MNTPSRTSPADAAGRILATTLKVLTEPFSSAARRRHVLKHYRRGPVPEAPVAPVTPDHAPAAQRANADLLLASTQTLEATCAWLQTTQLGLTQAQAAQRLAQEGPNEVAHEAPLSGWRRLWQCYLNPFNVLLTVLATLSWLEGDGESTVVVGLMIGLSTLMRFIQEGRSHRAADALRSLVSNTATVLRIGDAPGQPVQQADIPVRALVRGDRITLAAGDMIPADCRILTARDLFVAQSSMTGESAPVEKSALGAADPRAPLDQPNLVLMGTSVVSGAATALVLATGPRTLFGTLAAHVLAADTMPNAFQAGINSISWLLIRFGAAIVPIVLLINGWSKGNWVEALLFAMSVAVGLTPEMLPMIVTSTLARGAVRLSDKKIVVKGLDAIHNLGAMDVLCSDKTGTLTQDKIALARTLDPYGQPSTEVLNFAFLNSHYQTGLKNLIDRAVLEHVELATELKLEQEYRKIDEIPFDFVRRRMSVVVSESNDHHELICKGALDEVLSACTRLRLATAELALDATALAAVSAHARQLNVEGLRVVAVAMKELPLTQTRYSVADEAGLTLVGLIAFVDPPKESAAPALSALARHGVRVKVLTGDSDVVLRHVGALVKLAPGPVILGSQVEALDDAALQACVDENDYFARLTPLHKERIVRALRARGHIVGFIGDGINDAPALRAADIGISVDSAVDIAKEAADIILLEKSLMVLDDGVLERRTTFCNMLKYIRMTASSNFGNVLSILLASIMLPFLPMLPLQLLVQNLLYDLSQSGIPFDHVDPELIDKPLHWNQANMGRFMLLFGPISSIFDLVTFSVMWWGFGADSPAKQTLFQSGWFVVGLLTQTLVVHLIRTPQLSFIDSRAAAPLIATSAAVAIFGVWLPGSVLAPYFGLQPLPPAYFIWLALILSGYGVLASWMKRVYIRHFGWQ